MTTRLLIWDFDGTLGYRESGAWTASLFEVLQREAPETVAADADATFAALREQTQVGFPWLEPEEPHPHLDTPDRWWAALAETFARAYLGIGIADDLAHDLASRVRRVYLDPARWRRYDDVGPVLEALTATGWRHVILSNHVPELPDIVQAVGLRAHFERIFNSADLGYEKPHPRIFDAVLSSVGDGAERIWMIGDSYRADVQGAEAAGIPAILVRRHHPEAQRFAETLAEVPGMLA